MCESARSVVPVDLNNYPVASGADVSNFPSVYVESGEGGENISGDAEFRGRVE